MSDAATSTRIAWIGTGVMGAAMAGRLLDAGHDLVVFNRTRAKAEPLLERGATWAESPREAAGADVEVAVTIVGHPHDVEQTWLDPEIGLLHADPAPAIAIDMTTSRPALAERLAEAAAARGIIALDAPVSGGDVGARDGTLSIMVGGDAEAVDRVRPLFEALGRAVTHLGPAGAGQHTKMVNQTLIASTMVGVCEGLVYAKRAGLDPTRVLEAVGGGAAGSWTVANLAPRMIDRNFDPGFFVEHFIKDMGIALDEARRMDLALPGLALAEQLYHTVVALGHERSGTHALLLAVERLAGE